MAGPALSSGPDSPRVAELDREEIRTSVIERFSVERMTDGYEAVYERLLAAGGAEPVAVGPGGVASASSGDTDVLSATAEGLISADRLASRRADRQGAAAGAGHRLD